MVWVSITDLPLITVTMLISILVTARAGRSPCAPDNSAALHTPGELEGIEARMPVDTIARDVLVGIPEGAVVTGINGHAAVIAPPALTARLRSGTFKYYIDRFHSPQPIGGDATRVSDGRTD